LTQSINTDNTQEYIVLLEDIDTLFLNREYEDTDKEARKVINKLLQFLDSNSSPNNVIFIATTNYVDRLDKALLRAGRFDIKVEVKALDYQGTVKFGESFGLSRSMIDSICMKHVEEGEDIKKQLYNQSTLQIEFISNLSKKSLEDVTDMYAETLGLEVKKSDIEDDEDDDEF
jgi:ATP-dependent 26S proteasome regulatory subunit